MAPQSRPDEIPAQRSTEGECHNTASGVATFQGSHGATIHGGTYYTASAVRHEEHHHYTNERDNSLEIIRRLLRGTIVCEKRHQDVRDVVRGREAAGMWLLQESKYVSWKTGESETPFFWLTGVPGAGKTVLSSGVINDILKARDQDSKIYLMFHYGEGSVKHSPTTVFASLLAQLLCFLPVSADLDLRQYANATSIDDLPLVHLILHIIRQCKKTQGLKQIFIVIDGLDECDELRLLIQGISTLANDARIFIASRDHPVICGGIGEKKVELQVHPENIADDVQNYVTTAVQPIRAEFGQELADEIVDKLTTGSKGTFLWPVFHMRKISRLRTPHAIQEALRSLPEGIEETFIDALKSIRPGGRAYDQYASKHLFFALRWSMCATRPLKLRELQEAVAIPEMDSRWDSLKVPKWKVDECANLLVCEPPTSDQPDSQVVLPFHASVKEFLLKNTEWMMESSKPKEAKEVREAILRDIHHELARCCLSYMSLRPDGVKDLATAGGNFPFAAYAIEGWLEHIRQASGTPALVEVFKAFIESDSGHRWRSSVHQSLALHQFLPLERFKSFNAIHMAVVLDIPAVIPYFKREELMAKNDQGLTPLRFAIKKLGWSISSNRRSDPDGGNLQVEKRANQLLVIECLVKERAQIDYDGYGRTPLHIAAVAPGYHLGVPEERKEKAKNYTQVMQILLENDNDNAKFYCRDQTGRTPLHLAAQEGVDFATDFLLRKTVAINAPSDDGYTPLHLAIGHRFNNRSWSKRNLSTTDPGFPEYGHRQLTIKHLLEHGADANAQTTTIEKWSPLHLAASTQSDPTTFALLVEHQGNVAMTGHRQITPLHLAAKMAPILTVDMPVQYWDISWVACRQIIEMLIPLSNNEQSDLDSMRNMAKGVLKVLEKVSNRPVSIDPRATDDPCTIWFKDVTERLRTKGASLNSRNYQGYNVLRYAMSFWVSWIFRYRKAVEYRISRGELDPKHNSSLDTAYAEWTTIDKLLSNAKASQPRQSRKRPWAFR